MTVSTTVVQPVLPAVSPSVGVAAAHPVALAPRTRRRPGPAGRLVSRVGTDAVAASVAAGLGILLHPATPLLAAVVVAGLWTTAVALSDGYARTAAGTTRSPRQLVRAAALLGLLGVLAAATAPGAVLGDEPGPVLRAGLVTLTSAAALSALLDLATRSSRRRPVPVVLAGAVTEVAATLAELARPGAAGRWEPVAVCAPAGPALGELDQPGLVTWPGVEHVLDAVRAHQAQAVVVVPGPDLDHARLRRLDAALRDEGADLLLSTGLHDVGPSRVRPLAMGGLRTLHVRPAARRGPARLVKSAVDRTGAALLLVAFAPLLLSIAVAVRRDSPGPAIYRQTRVGRHGRLFTVYKFRTMCNDADRVRAALIEANESDHAGALFKIRRDPRITRIGARLRTWSLDELPQLLNVLRGEMSLIGPRPALPAEVECYPAELWQRLEVRPGITGLWQVSGRSDLSWAETVRADLSYVDNWSWAQDASIAVRTVGAVVGHRGAY